MRFGPTSLQVSSVLAKGLRRPKMRSDLRISEQTVAGETSYVIKNPETNTYNRFGATEYELLACCDGTRTPAEMAEVMTKRHPDQPITEAEMLEFLDSVEPAMWERSVGEKNLAVLERIRDERKSRLDQSNLLYISFKAWDPDKTLTWLDPYLSWMFTRGFVIFTVILLVTVSYLLAGDWTRVQHDTGELYSFANKSSYDIWAFWVLLMLLGAIHEFGHGLTCKHYGGDVHQMGFLLIYFTPAFYTDTTDIVLFQRGFERLWVIFAGIWVEMVVCGISALLWHFTNAGSLTNDLAYKMMLMSGIQGSLLNLNPLIKADGYYALSQFLDIDNLREDAFAYLFASVRKYIFRQDIELPPASRRQRRIFLIFGTSAILYSTVLLLVVLTFVKNVMVSKFGEEWGIFATACVVYFFTRKRLRAAVPVVRAWLREKREEYMAWKMSRAQQAGLVCLGLLLVIPPVPTNVATDMVLEPGMDARVRAGVAGKVGQVLVHQGDMVQPGQVLAVLENPQIEEAALTASAQLALAHSKLRSEQDLSDRSKAAQAAGESSRLEKELAVAQRDSEALQVRSTIAGMVTTPEVEQKSGEFLAAGDEFCRVADRSTMKARILVRDWELEDVRPGASAKVKVLAYPGRSYSGRVEQILPAAALDRPISQPQKLERLGQDLTNYFAVIMDFPNPDGSLREGMTGTAKISAKSYSLAWHFGRSAWRWMHSQVW
ncbi:MAG: efflux RND transporter periplasmic adaptor subunit [Candidatus Acidiferrales bacterium]